MHCDIWAEHEVLHPQGKAIEEMPCAHAKARRQIAQSLRAPIDARAELPGLAKSQLA